MSELGFVHRFEPGEAGGPVLLLLHGTGGDENDLIPLGRALSPAASLLCPRGQVSEGGALRFFRRLAEGVFDREDLARRTDDLAAFVEQAAARYGFATDDLVAVGFSNGANIAASLLLSRPGLVRRAILLSVMLPFEPDTPPTLAGTSVFISSGRNDPIVPPQQVERLEAILRSGGATVSVHWHDGGHGLPEDAFAAASDWLANG